MSGWTPAFLARWMAPLTMTTFLVRILHCTAKEGTFSLVEMKIWIALETLILGRTITTFAILVAPLTDIILIYIEPYWAFSYTRRVFVVIER